MNTAMMTTRGWQALLMLALFIQLLSNQAAGADAVVTAWIDTRGKFTNTTATPSFCRWFTQGSACWNQWAVNLPLTYYKSIDLSVDNDRAKVYVRPPPKQILTVVNESTGQTASITIEVGAISQKVRHETHPVVERDINGTCTSVPSYPGSNYRQHLWYIYTLPCVARMPSTPGSQQVFFNELGMIFYPTFPDTATLSPGRWEGRLTYQLGAPTGFDFGEMYGNDTDSIDLVFRFNVLHDMQVEMPSAGTELSIMPPGGWNDFMVNQRIPERLYKNVPLQVWASSTFMVYLACQYPSRTNQCNIKHLNGTTEVPVQVALTLPGTFSEKRRPVDRLQLLDGRSQAKLIAPLGNVSNQPGTLHFDVIKADIEPMVKYPGKYSGWITIIYDANP
ncbi:hypothetical protein [Pseudomonas coleopterorum]|uniref:hypothetical protein n=1 Tax=Pseudomonas coleopterorum TaxID=1605838 RepID=UPI000895C3CB|nr:hypothetical protein [Pseudomonas coleopterorum]SED86564.1 hypothetical protein SAMN05216510_0652 [Pseudomonas coleopterorum]